MRATLLLLALVLISATVASADDVPVVRFEVDAFAVEGENPIDAATTDEILQPYTGAHAGVDGLLAAADALEQALAARGYGFHRVVLPPQKLNEGTVTLQVTILTLGEVSVTGNERVSEQRVRAMLPALEPGVTPNTREVGRALDFANTSPARTLYLTMREAREAGAIDAEVRVEERRPWLLFSALNNIGTEDTGRLRLSVGAQHSDLFNRDHRFAASYTMSPDNADDVTQIGLQYQIPLYFDSSTLSVFYIHSDVDVGEVGGFFDVSGAGDFFGISYSHRMLNIGNYSHGWQLSLQDRQFENQFAGDVRKVRSRPFMVGYDGAYRTTRARYAFYVNFAKNVTNGAHNDDRAYLDSPRVGAEASWEALRFGGSVTFFLPRQWMVRTLVDAQLADEPLIAGEQFGVGGMSSVRGFEEREIAGDSGYRGSLEIWSPPADFIPGLRALFFYDIGQKSTKDALAFEPDSDTIASVGGGLRWQWQEQMGINVDYGYSLAGVQQPGLRRTKDSVKWHFTLYYRY